jgi:hypothetical protein
MSINRLFINLQLAFDVFAGIAIAKGRAFFGAASHFGDAAGPRNEGADFLSVVADLHPVVIDDDRAAENGRILTDELNQLGYGHIIEVDVILGNDLTAGRDDIICPIFGFGNDFHQIVFGKFFAENIFLLVRDILIIEPFFDFAAAAATGGIINLDHKHKHCNTHVNKPNHFFAKYRYVGFADPKTRRWFKIVRKNLPFLPRTAKVFLNPGLLFSSQKGFFFFLESARLTTNL